MRDRRNTNLSTSSASSTDSTLVSPIQSNLNEKDTDLRLEEGTFMSSVTKENRSKPRLGSRKWYITISTLILIALGLRVAWRRCHSFSSSTRFIGVQEAMMNVQGPSYPEQPSRPAAVSLIDSSSRQRWTVSIPNNLSFPLPAKQYMAICKDTEGLQKSNLGRLRSLASSAKRSNGAYYAYDPSYIDVAEAQQLGLLPVTHDGSGDGTCESSLTFVMDAEDASFGKTLLLLWLSYGLAKAEKRSFFIDDSDWSYGSYASYFPMPPRPSCNSPPPFQIVPCPHQAKHIVVSAATAQWTFGAAFNAQYGSRDRRSLSQDHMIYDLLRSGYEALFQLIGEDAEYAADRALDLRSKANTHRHPLIGMHVRHGDLHPLEFQFSRDYLPLERYTAAARTLVDRPEVEPATSFLVLASDDPEIVTSTELGLAASPLSVLKAQERIQLATKAALDLSSPAEPVRTPGSAYVKHVDENAGWDGGFYSALFFSLGVDKTKGESNDEQETKAHGQGDERRLFISEQAMRMRELIGRGYLLDLAVLSQTDGVVCALSSAACRILGVMMGREAIDEGRWLNVDDGRPWSWTGW